MLEAASRPVSRIPSFVARALRPLPLLPLEVALQRLLAGIVARHPGLLSRLGGRGWQRMAIDPNDMPFVILLEPRGGTITLRVVRELGNDPLQARIRGPLLALIGLVDGTYDGDALFFSRDLLVEGDVEAVLALRNAIDDAELRLMDEVAAWAGPFDRAARGAIAIIGRFLDNSNKQERGNT